MTWGGVTKMLKICLQKILKSQRGQAIVEFAVIIPIFLVMLLGLLEWGFVLWTQTTFNNAVRDGAREAVVLQDWDVNYSQDASKIIATVSGRLTGLPSAQTQNIADNITIELLPNSTNIESIRISIAAQPYVPLIGITGVAVPGTLSATSEFRYEGNL